MQPSPLPRACPARALWVPLPPSLDSLAGQQDSQPASGVGAEGRVAKSPPLTPTKASGPGRQVLAHSSRGI